MCVLIVDDTALFLEYLSEIISVAGYKVKMANRGKMAIEMAHELQPALILLDVNMPDISGYEVCSSLKSDPETSHIPIIFLSGMEEEAHRVKGFRVGAVDYVNKPFYPEEILARVKTHLNIRKLQEDLEKRNKHLSMEINERKKMEASLKYSESQLKELNEAKDKLFSVIAHDLKNPFNSILGFSDLLLKNLTDYDYEKIRAFVSLINTSAQNAYLLLQNLLEWAKTQTGQHTVNKEELNLTELIQQVCCGYSCDAQLKNINLCFNPEKEIACLADVNFLKTVLRNVIGNAMKYTHQGGRVDITTKQNNYQTEIIISDNGIGMSDETMKHIFSLNGKCSVDGTAQEKGSGLGLILCREFIQLQEGNLIVESKLGKGSRITIQLPSPQGFRDIETKPIRLPNYTDNNFNRKAI
jgi:two-component system, sensor histidine kinase and response regulator